MEKAIRLDADYRSTTAPSSRSRKCQAEASAGRSNDRDRCDAGVAGKKVVTVERKRETVVFFQTKEVSERRPCQLILLAHSTCQYKIKRQPDEKFENQVKELAFVHPRYDYQRVRIALGLIHRSL